MLGTGNPRPDPDRAGPATAIVVNDTPYLVDFGAGVIRRASAAYEKGVIALGYGGANIKTAFLTHMHADHTIGYPDLIITPWVSGRREPLTVYGPHGIKAMTDHVLEAWRIDLETRTRGTNPRNLTGCRVNAREIAAGVIYKDSNLEVTAFPTRHETPESYGFRFDTTNRSVVISGDTSPTQALLDHGRNCDVLIHEVYPVADFGQGTPQFQKFQRDFHTSSLELAQIAHELNPGLLVLYHRGNRKEWQSSREADEILLMELRQDYRGAVAAARDLDVF